MSLGNKNTHQAKSMSKYEKPVWDLLSRTQWASTNELKTKIERKTGKFVNWFLINSVLCGFERQKKVVSIRHERIVLWKRI